MRTAALERLKPVCLACRARGAEPSRLVLGTVVQQVADDVIEGALICSTRSCQREYPIIDGIPIIVPDVAEFLRGNEGSLLARDDLSPYTHSIFADSLDTDSSYSFHKATLSSYAQTQFGSENGLRSLLDQALPRLTTPPHGTWLDIGCATAGGSALLADSGAEMVLGIDLNVAMLRFGRRLITTGKADYLRRVSGVVYEPATVELDQVHADSIELWACSAIALPFFDGTFDGALSCNVVDVVDVPIFHLAETGRVLRDQAEAIIASPYDWTSQVTELPRWIGGHSQRSDSKGSSADEMRRLLSDDSPAAMNICLRLVDEIERVSWRVYLHERSSMAYETHVIVARATR